MTKSMLRSAKILLSLILLVSLVHLVESTRLRALETQSVLIAMPAPCDRVGDSLALVSLYQTTAGFNWTNQWNLNLPMNTWYGVTLNPEGCVDKVQLELNGLNGNLPAALGNLSQITELRLGNNINLVGNLPTSITNLTTLEVLNIGGCNLTGSLPAAIGNLTALTELNLRSNQLQGALPPSIGSLVNLLTIDLGNNGFSGSIPSEIGQLNNLFFLYLDNNAFSGAIPAALGDCTNLIRLWLDDNNLSGTIPSSFGNLTMLQVLWLSRNELSGPVPDSFQNMSSLNHLEIQFNNLTYLPDLSGLPVENQVNKLRIQGNNFSFDDILPNFGQALGTYYAPQDTVGMVSTINGCIDERIVIDLGIDSGITSNVYEWSRNGGPYGGYATIVGSPELVFQNSTAADAGVYTCRVTNPNAPLLELFSFPVTISMSCCAIEATVDPVLCPGETLTVNGTIYGEPPAYPSAGLEIISNATSCGEDSIVTVVLSFYPEAIGILDTILCAGGSLTVNGTVYDLNNPSGEEVLPGAAQNGCDSTVQISLAFFPPITDTFSTVLCPGGSIIVNGTVYNETNPQGEETFSGAAQGGCDSLVFVSLSFEDSIITDLVLDLCAGDTVLVNGTSYHANNTNGTEVLTSQQGCDSIIHISLTFYPIIRDTTVEVLCAGSGWLFGGETLTQTGFYRDTLQSVAGCDSFVFLDLTIQDTFFTSLEAAICEGDSLIFNGSYLKEEGIYQETLFAETGCDSTIRLELQVLENSLTQLNVQICAGETYAFQGDTLFISGIYQVVVPAGNGCDSIVQLTLEVRDTFFTKLDAQICAGETYDFLGVLLSDAGTYRDTLAAQNGCDSVLVLQLEVLPVSLFTEEATICANEFFIFQGDTLFGGGTYRDTLPGQNGCDSIRVLELTVLDTLLTQLSDSLCYGSCLTFGMDTLCAGGIYTRVLTAANGCDSLIRLEVTMLDTFQTILDTSFCAGDFIDFFGIAITQSGLYSQVLPASNGCDSLVQFAVTVLDTFRVILYDTICANESVPFFGTELQSTGTYQHVLQAQSGCDSTIELRLEVLDTFYTYLSAEICAGEFFDFYGNQLVETGTYLDTLAAGTGCDSIIQLDLIVYDTFQTFLNASICQGETYTFLGNPVSQAGTYFDTLVAATGCDSIFILALEVLDTFRTDLELTICKGETVDFLGQILAQSGLYRDTLLAQSGCDSFIVLDLTVLDTFRTIQEVTLCAGEEYNFSGTLVFVEGIYKDTLVAQNGCDSILELHLEVLDTFRTEIFQSVCAGDSIVFNQEWISTPGAYSDTLPAVTGCDSILVLNLSTIDTIVSNLSFNVCGGESIWVNGSPYFQSGTYREVVAGGGSNGCDSIIYFDLTVVDGATFGYAAAGPDLTVCEDSTLLTALLPANVTGSWAVIQPSVAIVDDPAAPEVLISGLVPGEQVVVWSLSTPECPDYDQDSVVIYREGKPNAFDDLVQVPSDAAPYSFSIIDNDFLNFVTYWDLDIATQPNLGSLTIDDNTGFTFDYTPPLPGNTRFFYSICNTLCPELCDTARVSIEPRPGTVPVDSIFIPNTITPNGDGLNDVFEIGNLSNLQIRYPKNEMIIFNRWGDVLYEQSPYVTPWNGSENNNGKILPEGTYYYVFRLDARQGKIYRGDITILR